MPQGPMSATQSLSLKMSRDYKIQTSGQPIKNIGYSQSIISLLCFLLFSIKGPPLAPNHFLFVVAQF